MTTAHKNLLARIRRLRRRYSLREIAWLLDLPHDEVRRHVRQRQLAIYAARRRKS